jgi:hypothetical protein
MMPSRIIVACEKTDLIDWKGCEKNAPYPYANQQSICNYFSINQSTKTKLTINSEHNIGLSDLILIA